LDVGVPSDGGGGLGEQIRHSMAGSTQHDPSASIRPAVRPALRPGPLLATPTGAARAARTLPHRVPHRRARALRPAGLRCHVQAGHALPFLLRARLRGGGVTEGLGIEGVGDVDPPAASECSECDFEWCASARTARHSRMRIQSAVCPLSSPFELPSGGGATARPSPLFMLAIRQSLSSSVLCSFVCSLFAPKNSKE
jgi:hypothetical protein